MQLVHNDKDAHFLLEVVPYQSDPEKKKDNRGTNVRCAEKVVEHGEEGSLRKVQFLYLDMPEVSLARNADMIASLVDGREYGSSQCLMPLDSGIQSNLHLRYFTDRQSGIENQIKLLL